MSVATAGAPVRVLIVGGGIGGLTAALALGEGGFDVHVYEQAAVLREVGAGVAVGPNAVRVLHRLGLADALRAVGVASLSWDERDWESGAILTRVPLAEAASRRWGAPFYNMHRADLHDALRAAVRDQQITLGARCVSVEQDAENVTIGFADGRQATGDLLIGADGVHSAVRDHVAGPAHPTWWRQTAWRGLAPAAVGHEVGLEMRQHVFLGPGILFVTYYVASGRLVNWIGCAPSDGWREESWSARGDREEALGLFAGWHTQVRALIAGTDAVFRWAMFDRPPLERWTRGRVTLLGDAAHPMLPFMGQGAAQSIEDALVLARCLGADRHDPLRAIDAYASRRQQRTAALQAASRAAGGMLQLSDQAEVDARNSRMLEDPEAQVARFDWVWGYDVDRAMADGPAHGRRSPPSGDA
jgi:2-polyprenyl-6-methoxyphenol hydroxylase-like FAD-dependent oxidoreductase